MEREDLGRYSRDWHLHRGDERYLSGLLRYCSDVGETDDPISARGEGFNPMPADILMWQIGRTFSHSAIVTEWPRVVHASLPAMRVLEEDIRFGPVYTRKMRVFSFWGPR